jgi:Putative DNA-binding domain
MGDEILARCATAKRESKLLDFKEHFDPDKKGDWCEITKDLVAMANSGGGVILFGVKNNGEATDFDPAVVLAVDPAKITDKIAAYTGEQFANFEIAELTRYDRRTAAIWVRGCDFPLVFKVAGNYDPGDGKQKTAFQNGTVYFRHGAKSEPGNASDLRSFVERELKRRRKEWLRGIRKVVAAPRGHRIEILGPGVELDPGPGAVPVRLVTDPSARAIRQLNPDQNHPYRQKELIVEIQRGLGERYRFTSYDNLSVRKAYGVDHSKPEFFYQSRFGSPQYSQSYVDWLVGEFDRDAEFFRKAIRKVRGW